MSRSSTKLIQSIDVVRGFSILAVLCGHFTLVDPLRTPSWAWSLFLLLAANGAYGVSTFFVASGFLITRMIDGRNQEMFIANKPLFYIRRASRIFPTLALAGCIGILLFLHGGDRGGALAVTFKDPKADFGLLFWSSILLFFFNWLRIATETANACYGLTWDVLWSLAIEEQFYIGYPFMLSRLGTTKRLVRVLALVIVSGPAYRLAAAIVKPESFLLGFTSSFAAFDQLAIGVLSYIAWRDKWFARLPGFLRSSLPAIGVFLAGIAYVFASLGSPVGRTWGPTVLATGIGLLFASGLDHPVFELAFWRPLKILGRASYEAYLFHGLVLYLLWPVLIGRNFLWAFSGYLIAVTTISTAVHLAFGEPAKKKLAAALQKLLGVKSAGPSIVPAGPAD
ncbi:MAG TPA: acyltransferase [Anaeromyxobacter sp.]